MAVLVVLFQRQDHDQLVAGVEPSLEESWAAIVEAARLTPLPRPRAPFWAEYVPLLYSREAMLAVIRLTLQQ